MGPVIIGMDPHKRSATVEIIDPHETVLRTGRFATDQDGCQRMLAVGRHHPQRLVADGETVVDVPAKLSARRYGAPVSLLLLQNYETAPGGVFPPIGLPSDPHGGSSRHPDPRHPRTVPCMSKTDATRGYAETLEVAVLLCRTVTAWPLPRG